MKKMILKASVLKGGTLAFSGLCSLERAFSGFCAFKGKMCGNKENPSLLLSQGDALPCIKFWDGKNQKLC